MKRLTLAKLVREKLKKDDLVVCGQSRCDWSGHAAQLGYVSCPRHRTDAARYMSEGEKRRLRCHGSARGRPCGSRVDHVYNSRFPSACPLCAKHGRS